MLLHRPRPVLTSAGISGAINATAVILAFLGYNDASARLSSMATSLTSVGLGVFVLGAHLLAGLHSQAKVTPLSSPQDHDGTPLVRMDVASASVASAPADSTEIGPMEDDSADSGDMEPVEMVPDAPESPAPATEPAS